MVHGLFENPRWGTTKGFEIINYIIIKKNMKKQNTSELYAKAIKLCMQSGPENKMKKSLFEMIN